MNTTGPDSAATFGILGEELRLRFDPFFNSPEHRILEKRLLECPFGAEYLGDSRISRGIFEGRVTPKRHAYSTAVGDPFFLRAQNVEEGLLQLDDAKRLKPECFDLKEKAILNDGDVVLTIDGVLLGKAAVYRIADGPCCISNHMVRILVGSAMGPDFLAWFLNSASGQKQIQRSITGSAIPGLRTNAIARILVPLVPPKEQAHLVGFLDNARANKVSMDKKADELLAGIGEKTLNLLGIVPPNIDVRHAYAVLTRSPGFGQQLAANYYNPERLEAIRAMRGPDAARRDVFALRRIVDFVKHSCRTSPQENYVGLANIEGETGEFIEAGDEPSGGQCFRFSRGDVLYARLRPYLNKVWAADRDGICSMEFHVLRLKPAFSFIHPEYLASILRSSLVVAQTKYMMTGNTHPRLANDDVRDLRVPIPEGATQHQIVAQVQQLQLTARQLRQEAKQNWKDSKRYFDSVLFGDTTICPG